MLIALIDSFDSFIPIFCVCLPRRVSCLVSALLAMPPKNVDGHWTERNWTSRELACVRLVVWYIRMLQTPRRKADPF